MKRRDFIAGLGSAAALPLAAGAQQADRMRHVGVLMGADESDADASVWLSALMQGLLDLGWAEGRNVTIDVRWAGVDFDRVQTLAKQLVDLQTDVIVANNPLGTAAFQRETRTIPIVFVLNSDPIGSGFVASLARPGGNITGFSYMEASMGGKLLELLTEIAPDVKRAALMFNPRTAAGGGSFFQPSFMAAAQALKIEPIIARVSDGA
jgi:putative ABC transport system substrate-binding protein